MKKYKVTGLVSTYVEANTLDEAKGQFRHMLERAGFDDNIRELLVESININRKLPSEELRELFISKE